MTRDRVPSVYSELDHIAKCIKAGLTAVQTAATVGCSEKACRAAAKSLGIAFRPVQPSRHDNDFGTRNFRTDDAIIADYRERDLKHQRDLYRANVYGWGATILPRPEAGQ